MKQVFLQVIDAIMGVVKTFFMRDLDVMSDEVREILSNPDDAKKYRDAVNKIKEGSEQETIELSGKRRLTLTQ